MSRWVPTSLSARLVATVVALVAVVSLLISAATAIAMSRYLTERLDNQVAGATDRAVGALERGSGLPSARASTGTSGGAPTGPSTGSGEEPGEEHRGDEGPGEEHEPREGPEVENASGQGVGTLTAYLDSFGPRAVLIDGGTGGPTAVPAADLGDLGAVPADGEPHTADLPGLGSYRLVARDTGSVTVVSGLPTRGIEETLESLLWWELLLSATGVLLVAVAGRIVIGRQLRPLREVASTAHEVSEIPLSTGAITMDIRVPHRLTDPHTEVGQVGAALNRMLGHVEGALDARHRSEQQVRQFVADASHELRTPLATIHGYAQLSRRSRPSDPDQLAHAMAKVEHEATRMSALVEDLLLLARLDAGRPLDRAEVDLTKLVLEAVGDARVVAPGHQWVLDLADEPVVVTGDEHRLHQVLTNLLNNARRHTPPGTRVSVGARLEPGSVPEAVLSVHDDGPGISEELAGTVFERFARGDSSRTRSSGGAGLGLSLVQAITAAHGGRVDLRSRPGATTFEVRLPVVPA